MILHICLAQSNQFLSKIEIQFKKPRFQIICLLIFFIISYLTRLSIFMHILNISLYSLFVKNMFYSVKLNFKIQKMFINFNF